MDIHAPLAEPTQIVGRGATPEEAKHDLDRRHDATLEAWGIRKDSDDFIVVRRASAFAEGAAHGHLEELAPAKRLDVEGSGTDKEAACENAIATACTKLGRDPCAPWRLRVLSLDGESLAGFRDVNWDAAQAEQPASGDSVECSLVVVMPDGERREVTGSGSTLALACTNGLRNACGATPCPTWTRADTFQGIPFRSLPNELD